MSVVLFLGLVVGIMVVLDLLVGWFSVDSRPEFGIDHQILSV